MGGPCGWAWGKLVPTHSVIHSLTYASDTCGVPHVRSPALPPGHRENRASFEPLKTFTSRHGWFFYNVQLAPQDTTVPKHIAF